MKKPFNEHSPRETKWREGFIGFHGDVTAFGVDSMPKNFLEMDKVTDNCIAYGEATGHAHELVGNPEDFDLRRDPKTKVEYLRVHNMVFLKHQEHSPVKLPPGDYRFGRKTEYDPFAKRQRQVID